MPSPAEMPALCVIGDSHLGSLRRAVDAGLVRFPGLRVEFWGATGPQFRQIDMKDGVIRARGPAREMVRRVNARGRTEIRAEDFPVYLFYGARLRVAEFFAPFLHRKHIATGFQSRAVLDACADRFLRATRAFRIAAGLAETGAEVQFAPAPFPTAGVVDLTEQGQILYRHPDAVHAEPADRDRLWQVLCDRCAASGVNLIRQPEDTVVDGIQTDPCYAIERAVENGDPGHKSPEFAARLLGGLTESELECAA